jgi:hypothetical protein
LIGHGLRRFAAYHGKNLAHSGWAKKPSQVRNLVFVVLPKSPSETMGKQGK